VYEISQLLNTGLDRRTVQILMALCDAGVNPQALARVVQELRREAAAVGAAAGAATGNGAAPDRPY
jgi:mitotic-spindle organizing protein 1